MKPFLNLFFLALFMQVQTYAGSAYIFEESEELYWPTMNIEEVHEMNKDTRSPSAENIEYKSIEELKGLVDVCWYRCSFVYEKVD